MTGVSGTISRLSKTSTPKGGGLEKRCLGSNLFIECFACIFRFCSRTSIGDQWYANSGNYHRDKSAGPGLARLTFHFLFTLRIILSGQGCPNFRQLFFHCLYDGKDWR
uniref:Uncharacterized protein n=1 Tax=Utricularia reniformis TaxID=192314 RepID=A0A1Y0B3A8_9LAMI|nr:hypothetical protein AEK19_MT1711 [Utricularia reniformis]ART31891.1 hypothetical protein AEK19_MT1711 [Utricularia reniformis]